MKKRNMIFEAPKIAAAELFLLREETRLLLDTTRLLLDTITRLLLDTITRLLLDTTTLLRSDTGALRILGIGIGILKRIRGFAAYEISSTSECSSSSSSAWSSGFLPWSMNEVTKFFYPYF